MGRAKQNQLYSSSIPNFVNGVSQQPFTLRLSSQGEVQLNGLSTVSQGLKKRPPTRHLKKVSDTPLGDCYIHTVNRDQSERYVVVFTNGDLKVYDLAGNLQTVNFPNGKSYLSTTLAVSSSFSAVTVADYTFIVNKSKKVLANTTTTTARPYEALINVKSGNYGKTYKINVNGSTVASFTTPDGSVASQVSQISTDYIATQIYNGLVSSGYNAGAWSVQVNGSVVYLKNTSADFTISAEDGFNSGGMVAMKDKLQKFADLPVNPRIDGYVIQVVGTGDSSSTFDSYYVKFDAAGANGVGVWREWTKPGISVGLDASTMPYVLVREADGTFTFKQASWINRKVGDDASNSLPSCVNQNISDVFFFRNRLGFLSEESVIFSESGSYFNLFRTTVTALVDSDPIDVTASHTKVSLLKHAVPFNKQLLLFSEQTQFIVDQNDLLTPKTISLKVVTEFPCNVVAKPVGVGKNVYFSVDKGEWSAMREYFADLNNITNDSMDITGHVPKYIPSGVYKIAAAPNEDIMVLLSTKERNSMYVYKYFWSNNEKLQSSWSKWTFGNNDTVLNADFIASELFMVINRADGVYFEKINVSLGDIGTNEPYNVLLDRKVDIPKAAMTYAGGYTLIPVSTLGYTPSDGSYCVVVKNDQPNTSGEVVNATLDGSFVKVFGNYASSDLTFGKKYTFKYQLSTITIKQAIPTGGQKSDTEGRLQLRKVAFNYSDTSYFEVQITPESRPTYTYIYSGKILGTASATIGQYGINTGRFIAPVVSRNIGTSIVLTSDMPVPCSFLSADWEGLYVKRSQAV